MTRRILLVCYYFPPMGGAGVGRPLTLFKYLPEFGYDCDVLTVKPVAYRLHEPELLEGTDTRRIYRAGSWDPQRLMYLAGLRRIKDSTISRGRKVSDRFFPDPKIGWVRSAIKLGRVLAENRRYEYIVSTSPPISSHLVAQKLSEEFALPWVADFRDFWTGYKAEEWFDDSARVDRAKRLLADVVARASAVTVTNPAIADYLGRGEVIYNSFDEGRAKLWTSPKDLDRFTIGVLGTIDELRPIDPLLRLLAQLKESHPEAYKKVRVSQVGIVNSEGYQSQLEKYGISDRFEIHGLQKREETIRILSETSMLYIALASPHGTGVLPGRLFDMIASGRPILASVPLDGVVASLVREIPGSVCYDDRSVETAGENLAELIEAAARGDLLCRPNPEYAQKYSSRAMVENFSMLFDRTAAEKTSAHE